MARHLAPGTGVRPLYVDARGYPAAGSPPDITGAAIVKARTPTWRGRGRMPPDDRAHSKELHMDARMMIAAAAALMFATMSVSYAQEAQDDAIAAALREAAEAATPASDATSYGGIQQGDVVSAARRQQTCGVIPQCDVPFGQ
jgi:hypothetical protein